MPSCSPFHALSDLVDLIILEDCNYHDNGNCYELLDPVLRESDGVVKNILQLVDSNENYASISIKASLSAFA